MATLCPVAAAGYVVYDGGSRTEGDRIRSHGKKHHTPLLTQGFRLSKLLELWGRGPWLLPGPGQPWSWR